MSQQDTSLSDETGTQESLRGSVYDDAGSIHSESSLIFERNVEDPYSQVFSNPRLASLSRSGSNANLVPYDSHDSQEQLGLSLPAIQRKQSAIGSFVQHHNLENLVAPALDEGVTIVNDDSTDLESVEMIYSRRPSTIGLDMALGRTRTNSSSDAATLNGGANRLLRTNSASQGSTLEGRPRVLRFYSYADMISDENANPRRPSITQSLSSTLLRQQGEGTKNGPSSAGLTQVGSPSFSNPFLNSPTSSLEANRKNSNASIPPLAIASRHFSNNILSRSPNQPNTNTTSGHRLSTSPLMSPHNPSSSLLRKSNFQIESSGSECSDDDDHDPSNNNNSDLDRDVSSAGTLNTSPINPQGLRLSRTSTQGSNFSKKLSPPAYKARAYSNASGISPYANSFGRSSFSNANTQRLDDLLYDEQLQSNTASEVLKKKLTNEI